MPATGPDEGDHMYLRVRVARANYEQALIEFFSMEGPYSVRVPISELFHAWQVPAGDRA